MKHKLRKEMHAKLPAIHPDHAARQSRLACARLTATEEFQRARVIMAYLPMRAELDPTEAMLAAWRDNKAVLVPKTDTKHRRLIPALCRSLDVQFDHGSLGVREPAVVEPWPVDRIDLVIVPALAYDRRGHRLGRGAGYYDRFLAQDGVHAVAAGLAFVEQLLDELPTEVHDHPLDMIVTHDATIRFDHSVQPSPQHPAKAGPEKHK